MEMDRGGVPGSDSERTRTSMSEDSTLLSGESTMPIATATAMPVPTGNPVAATAYYGNPTEGTKALAGAPGFTRATHAQQQPTKARTRVQLKKILARVRVSETKWFR